MHLLHTTDAFLLRSYENGESNRVFKLFTRDFGILYAHAQSVRELKSRNRYALQTGTESSVTLVKGREVWRVTGAQAKPRGLKRERALIVRKALRLAERLSPVEEKNTHLYSVLEYGCNALLYAEIGQVALIEAVVALRVLDALGYVARPLAEATLVPILETDRFDVMVLSEAQKHSKSIFFRVNSALREVD